MRSASDQREVLLLFLREGERQKGKEGEGKGEEEANLEAAG